MRGKVSVGRLEVVSVGITPAYAGKRSSRRSAMHRKQDHPRLCGEKLLLFARRVLFLGSPPPMRGKGFHSFTSCLISRITPAYAGKSRKPMHCRKPMQDHPRLCGEKQ